MMLRRNGYRLSPDQAVQALMLSGTSLQDEQIMAAVRVTARPRVRRIAEQQRMTGSPIGWLVMRLGEKEQQDFVWGEMLAYWEDTGQIGEGEASAWGGLVDDRTWRDLGYQISYGASYDRPDPQLGADAPWQLGLRSNWTDAAASYWNDATSAVGWSAPESSLGTV